MKKKYSLTYFCVLPCFLFAQKKTDTLLKTKDIEQIIIAMKRNEDGVIASQKLSGKELQNINSLSVADAVRYFSGVQIKDYGGVGGLKTINIRGMGTQNVGVFYDGIQLGNAQNGTIDLGKFSLENMESVSVYNGQKSEILQSAKDFGSAGTIYLQTKIPHFTANKATNLGISYRSGSFDLINSSVLLEQKLSENIALSLNAEYTNASGKYRYKITQANPKGEIDWQKTDIRKNGAIEAIRLEGGLFGNIKNGSWKAKAYYYQSDRGIPGAVVKNISERYEHQWDKNFFAQISFNKEWNKKYKLLINSKFANDYTHYLNSPPENDTKHIDNTYIQWEYYFSMAHQYAVSKTWDISLSTDYQYNKLDANLPSFAFPTRHTEMIALASQWRLWQKLKLQASILGTFIQERVEDTKFSNPAPAKQEYSPALFFSYEPLKSKTLKIHGFYKNIFRMPTFNDLYYSEIGFSNLKPEYTEQWDLGISFSKDFSRTLTHFNLTADVYHHISKDKIVAFPRGQQFRWTMLNLGKVDAKGVDISAQSIWLIARNLILNNRLSYTYEEAIDITNPEDFYYKHQIPYIPKHSGSMVLGLIYKDWAVNYSFLYTGKRHNMQANILSNFEQPWYTSDISIFREIPMKKMKIRAGLEVNNLFNQYYSVIRNFPMPGTNYRASLKIQF